MNMFKILHVFVLWLCGCEKLKNHFFFHDMTKIISFQYFVKKPDNKDLIELNYNLKITINLL